MIAILAIEIILLLCFPVYARRVVREIKKDNGESIAELMNIIMHVDEVRDAVSKAFAEGKTEVDLSEYMR